MEFEPDAEWNRLLDDGWQPDAIKELTQSLDPTLFVLQAKISEYVPTLFRFAGRERTTNS